MKKQVASNVACNWAGMAVTILAGFIVAPYLVHRLGDTVYGLWILIASMSGYFGLLDLGVRGSVGRYVAYYRARGEQEQVNRVLSTALVILSGVGILALLATLVVLMAFFHIFEVPPEHVAAARIAILILGINLAITFPVTAFDGVLWGYERFDLLNAVEIPTVITRTILTFVLVHGPDDITALAWITILTTAGNELAKLMLSFRTGKGLRFSVGRFELAHARQLYGYGFWQFLLQVARQVSMQIGPLVIGGMIAVAAVTPYSIASRLIGYGSAFMVAATGVLTPLATALHARNDETRERQLFMDGGKWCTAFALFVALCMVGLGKPLLELWMGTKLGMQSMPVLVVLTAGELLAMSQLMTYSIILGKAKHRAVAIASLAEGVIAGIGGAIAARHYGVIGVCVVFALAAFLCRGVFQVVYSCRAVGIGTWVYVRHALLGPTIAGAAPIALLLGATWWLPPATWAQLFVYGGIFAAVYGGSVFLMLGGLRYLPPLRASRWLPAEVEKAHV